MRTELGAEIRRRREGAGYSPEAFAAKVGIPALRYAALERGEGNLYVSMIERVADGLCIPAWELLRSAGL